MSGAAVVSRHNSTQSVAVATVNENELHHLLRDGDEIAVLDVREPGVAHRDHTLLLAVSAPLSRLEFRIAKLVPRKSTRIVVIDGDGFELALRASELLIDLGYTNVAFLEGGVSSWQKAGYSTYGGIQALGQAFGEFIEEIYDTPHLEVADVQARIAAGEDILLLDSRPIGEFENRSIPGAISVPGAELVLHAHDLVRSSQTTVVVNCAGRTRSIMGAQVLINAGLKNPVYALANGTMAWSLSGFPFAFGATGEAPATTGPGLDFARDAAERMAERYDVQRIDAKALQAFEGDENRTTYVLDVRRPIEYENGHRNGARSTPSWDIAPWVFRSVGTRNARLVLIDEGEQVRALVTATWLAQIGWGEVFVLREATPAGQLVRGVEEEVILGEPSTVLTVSPQQLAEEIRKGKATVVDVDLSDRFEKEHIRGAWFAVRAHLSETLRHLPHEGTIAFTSSDGVLARFAAHDAALLTNREVVALEGGTAAWIYAGLPLGHGAEQLLEEPLDLTPSAWRAREDRHGAFKQYLAWEVGLAKDIANDDTVPFQRFN